MPDSANMADIGNKAPTLSLPAHPEQTCDLAAAGGPVVLFFYPRDDTSGCTKEAIAFSQMQGDFADLGVAVWGISKDTLASHAKFAGKHALSVPLLSDAESDVCERYGVWKEKSMYGKTFMGIERSTFLIAADGTIAQVWRKVKVPGHAEAVLEAARAL